MQNNNTFRSQGGRTVAASGEGVEMTTATVVDVVAVQPGLGIRIRCY